MIILQKECYILDTPCITIRDQTEWIETLNNGYNILSKPEKNELYKKIVNAKIVDSNKIDYYGNGHVANEINNIILKHIKEV